MRMLTSRFVVTMALWALAAPVFPQDTTKLDNLVVKALKKPKEAFFATATLTATDNSKPPNGLGDAPFSGGIADQAKDPNWKLDLKYSNAPGYINRNPARGFEAVGLRIDGDGTGFGHLNAPHFGEKANNTSFATSEFKDITYGANNAVFLAAMGTAKHPVLGKTHFDTFGVRGTVSAQLGPPNRLVAPIDIVALHSDFDPSQNLFFSLFQVAVASAARVDFDRSTGSLGLRIGAVNTLDNSGGQTGAIDPRYASDPIRLAQWTISNLSLLGLGADGLYRFGGGTTELIDPSGRFHLLGRFDEFFIDNTPGEPVAAFGRLSHLSVADVGTPSAGQSLFLREFMGQNVFQDGVDEDLLDLYGGVVLSLGFATDLLDETQGFSRSAFNLPTSLTLAALQVPEPSSALLTTVALTLLLAVRARRQAIVALALALHGLSAMADTVSFTNPTFPRDTTQRFFASGTLTSTDESNPPDGIGTSGAPFVSVQGPNKNWRFRIRHNDNGLLGANAGVEGVRLGITGSKADNETAPAGHLVPPPGMAHAGEKPNSPGLRNSDRADIRFGANEAKFFSRWSTVEHASHFDAFGIRSTITAVAGPPLRLTGLADVTGIHVNTDPGAKLDFNGKPAYDPFKEALASTAGAGSTMSYDGLTGRLRFAPGRIDVLDHDAGRTGAIDPSYSGDVFRSALWSISDVNLVGMDAQGHFHFGAGALQFFDPAGRFSLTGRFDELVFAGSHAAQAQVGLGLLTELSVWGTTGASESDFLRNFVGVDMFLDRLTQAESDIWAGLVLTITTPQNFAGMTDDFRRSAFDVPSGFLLSAAQVPEPGGGALVATALLLCAVARQRWVQSQLYRNNP